jgi:hypothetical protein
MIREGAGKLFDPGLVEIFLKLESEFNEIAQNCKDVREPLHAESASDHQTADFSAKIETSIDDNISMVQVLLKECSGDSQVAAAPPRDERCVLEESPDLQISR